jgi:hypothetical protein
MCRAPFSLPAPPPPPLEGPSWYVMGNAPPFFGTSGAEWVERLNVIPLNPVMTLETLRYNAECVGRELLRLYADTGNFPHTTLVLTVMQIYGITRR